MTEQTAATHRLEPRATLTALATPRSRRSVLAAAVAAVAAAGLGRGAANAQDFQALALTTPYTADVALNLREGPGTNFRVLAVIPAGASVTGSTELSNGYRKVTYNGVVGWAVSGGLTEGSDGGAGDPGNIVSQARTTDALNFRAGPSTLDDVLFVIPAGTTIDLFAQSENGFRRATYRSTVGWAFAEFLSTGGPLPPPTPVGTAVTTDALNLRAGASSGAQVLLVIPAGATVSLGTELTNGYRAVTYNGTSGFAFATFLRASGGVEPGTAEATADLNLRAEPSTSARVLLVIPAGGVVVPTDQITNGFRRVSYNGTTGWAFNQFLA